MHGKLDLAFAAIFGLVDFATLAPTQLLAALFPGQVDGCYGRTDLATRYSQPAAEPWPLGSCTQKGTAVILPKERDPRFITIRRGGTLTDSDHRLLTLWAATCAEHVLHLFESA